LSHIRLVAPILVLAFVVSPARAQYGATSGTEPSPAGEVPGLARIGVDEQLGAQLPLDLSFRDEQGQTVQLRDFFDGRHAVLFNFAYFTCPTLCSFVLDGMVNSAKDVDWTAGDQYQIVTISIDPRDTPERALAKRQEMLAKYGRPAAAHGWHFLTGTESEIDRATRAAGFRYFYHQANQQYAHPAIVMAMTPDGKFARYLYGLEYPPNDLRLSLLEASRGHTLSTTDRIVLFCYHYDPGTHEYSLVAVNVMKLGGVLTMLAFALFFAVLFWRMRKRRRLARVGEHHVPVGH